jgi:hypothetical protein
MGVGQKIIATTKKGERIGADRYIICVCSKENGRGVTKDCVREVARNNKGFGDDGW